MLRFPLQIIFESLKANLYTKKQMPVLTIVNRFIRPSGDACLLCPNSYPGVQRDTGMVFTASLTWDMGKPEFPEWFNSVSITLSRLLVSGIKSTWVLLFELGCHPYFYYEGIC